MHNIWEKRCTILFRLENFDGFSKKMKNFILFYRRILENLQSVN
jgi:hypothetical protein